MSNKTVAHLGRLKDIAFTLLKFGFDDVVIGLDLPGKKFLGKKHLIDPAMTKWERIRLTLEELGPGFIKIGQILSLRPDVIPGELLLELRKLQDEVTPESFESVTGVVESELGRPLGEIFSFFDSKPLAAASLSQVHRAILRDSNKVVAVKVQRPGIRQVIEIDLHLLEIIANKAHEKLEKFKFHNFPGIVSEIKKVLTRELDFSREARHMLIAGHNFAAEPMAYIPKAYEKYSSRRMLTMELIMGSRMFESEAAVEDRHQLARTGLRLMIKQIFADGFYHADPHPGNVLIIENNIFCLLDWGMVGRLTATSRRTVLELVQAAIDKDSETVMENLLELASIDTDADFDEKKLENDIVDILDTYHSLSLQEVRIGNLLLELSDIVRQNRLRLPLDLSVMIKALITAEGMARELYPELNVVKESEPFIQQLVMEQWQPLSLYKRLKGRIRRITRFSKRMPKALNNIITELEDGRLSIRFVHDNLDEFLDSLENSTNRLTFGIIIGSIIIGSSMIITTGVKPLLFGYPALGVVGYLVSGLLGLWLVFNMIRSRKL
ncbi:MAG: hypothetical protein KQH63_18805 [Desulfobulbaceae bacterium]|nr:hypothetical protein [Desulfobulbaceae bacterium]